MNLPTRDHPMFSDDEIAETARSVQPHDFDRIAPPPQVWNNILAEVEEEVASQEAIARKRAKKRFGSMLLSAAAATLLMVGVVAAVVLWPGDDAPLTEVAAAAMTTEGLPVSTEATADATFVCDEDQCFVDVVLTDLPDSGDDALELWVINGDVSDMYSLGAVTEAEHRYLLPHGVTSQDFPIVDISVEPNDGDPTHSGQSVLRGVFEAG